MNKYYTTNSIKPFFSLLIINKYYTTNSVKSFVAIQFIFLLKLKKNHLRDWIINNNHSRDWIINKVTK